MGELDRADTSRSPSPTKVLPLPSSMSFTTRGLFIRNDRKPIASCRDLIDQLFTHEDASPTCKMPPRSKWLPDLAPDPPPYPHTNGMKQVNTRCALLLRLASSEAMVDNRSHGILNVEGVDGFMKCVRTFQFPALIHPDNFHHRSTRYYHHASWRFQGTRNRSQYPRRRTEPHSHEVPLVITQCLRGTGSQV